KLCIRRRHGKLKRSSRSRKPADTACSRRSHNKAKARAVGLPSCDGALGAHVHDTTGETSLADGRLERSSKRGVLHRSARGGPDFGGEPIGELAQERFRAFRHKERHLIVRRIERGFRHLLQVQREQLRFCLESSKLTERRQEA